MIGPGAYFQKDQGNFTLLLQVCIVCTSQDLFPRAVVAHLLCLLDRPWNQLERQAAGNTCDGLSRSDSLKWEDPPLVWAAPPGSSPDHRRPKEERLCFHLLVFAPHW